MGQQYQGSFEQVILGKKADLGGRHLRTARKYNKNFWDIIVPSFFMSIYFNINEIFLYFIEL